MVTHDKEKKGENDLPVTVCHRLTLPSPCCGSVVFASIVIAF